MDAQDHKPERIAKRIARAGLCSRREAERWINAGRVTLNGQTLDSPACTAGPGDEILVDGEKLPSQPKTRLFLYHKPAGLITSAGDEKGRRTVFDALSDMAPDADLPRLISIGRLDMNTEGLLLLTNDGALSRHLELPSTGWKRRYRVRAHGKITQARLDRLGRGCTIDGIKYRPIEAVLDRQQGTNCWLHVTLSEGKNREIRKVMESLGLQVNRLIRLSYGPFQLGRLKKGAIREVPEKALREQIPALSHLK